MAVTCCVNIVGLVSFQFQLNIFQKKPLSKVSERAPPKQNKTKTSNKCNHQISSFTPNHKQWDWLPVESQLHFLLPLAGESSPDVSYLNLVHYYFCLSAVRASQ